MDENYDGSIIAIGASAGGVDALKRLVRTLPQGFPAPVFIVLNRFFVREDGSYRVVGELREMCLFSRHDLLRDPPFSRLDLISCRNLLIYIDVDLQKRIIPLFHYALRDDGLLFLGASENVTRHAALFETVDRAHRIFHKRPHRATKLPEFPLTARAPQPRPFEARRPPAEQASLQERVERRLLDRYAPAYVLT